MMMMVIATMITMLMMLSSPSKYLVKDRSGLSVHNVTHNFWVTLYLSAWAPAKDKLTAKVQRPKAAYIPVYWNASPLYLSFWLESSERRFLLKSEQYFFFEETILQHWDRQLIAVSLSENIFGWTDRETAVMRPLYMMLQRRQASAQSKSVTDHFSC